MKTGCFFTYKGPGRISIARYAPRFIASGYKTYKSLAPGDFFNKVSEEEYRVLYARQLAQLNPQRVWDDLHRLAQGYEPILLCYERVDRGEFCHRRCVADWFRMHLGETVPEICVDEYGWTEAMKKESGL